MVLSRRINEDELSEYRSNTAAWVVGIWSNERSYVKPISMFCICHLAHESIAWCQSRSHAEVERRLIRLWHVTYLVRKGVRPKLFQGKLELAILVFASKYDFDRDGHLWPRY